jgi:hypothetical protein
MNASCACMGRISGKIWNAVKGSKHRPKASKEQVHRPSVIIGESGPADAPPLSSAGTLTCKSVLRRIGDASFMSLVR